MRGTQGNAGAAGGGQNHLREHREELGGDLSLDARREVVHLEQSLLALLRGVAHAGGDGARRAWCVHCASGVRAWRWRARAQVAWRGVAWRCVAGAAARLVRLLLEVHQRVVRVRLHLGLGAPRHPHLPSELNRWGMRRACLHVLMPPSCMSCMHGSVARRGVAWRGVAWRGVARRGAAWRGVVRRGAHRGEGGLLVWPHRLRQLDEHLGALLAREALRRSRDEHARVCVSAQAWEYARVRGDCLCR